MTKSNFEKLAEAPAFAPPPRPDEGASPIVGYGAVRAEDGRSARRTGRTVQFATVVSPEFKKWLKVKAAVCGKCTGRVARRHEGCLHRKIRRRVAMFLFKRKPKPAVEDETISEAGEPAGEVAADIAEPAEEPEPVRRVKQQNIKASEDCCMAFAAIAKALGMTKAAAVRGYGRRKAGQLRRQGVDVEASAG